MSKHPHESPYVLKTDCLEHVTDMENKLQMILNALRGPDLRGGLVRDVNKLFTQLALLQSDVNTLNKKMCGKETETKENRKLLAGMAGSLITAVISILIAIFK